MDEYNQVTVKLEAADDNSSRTAERDTHKNKNTKKDVSDQQHIGSHPMYSVELVMNENKSVETTSSISNQDCSDGYHQNFMVNNQTEFKLECDNVEVDYLNSGHGGLYTSMQNLNNDEGSSSSKEPNFDVPEQRVSLEGDGFKIQNNVTNHSHSGGGNLFPGGGDINSVTFPPTTPNTLNNEIERWNSYIREPSKSIQHMITCQDPPSSQVSPFNGHGMASQDTEYKHLYADGANSFLNFRPMDPVAIANMTNASSMGNKQLLHPCSYCEKVCSSRHQLVRHMKVHGEKPFKCTVCERSFRQNYWLTQHMKTHTVQENPYSCTVCDISFTHQKFLLTHMKTHTGEMKKRINCTVCKKSFEYNSQLKVHMRSHTGEKPYSCTVCEKSFSAGGGLQEHMQIHTGVKPHKCTVCERFFTTTHNFRQHMKIHTDVKPHKCTICEKSFTFISDLRRHMQRMHTSIRPHKCTVCERSFNQNFELTSHTRTHTGEKPYICSVCGMSFSHQSSMVYHMRTHTGEKPYTCSVCGKSYVIPYALTIHMKKHSGVRPYRCTVCEKTFFTSSHLRIHVKRHTGDKPFNCKVCDKSFYGSSELKSHLLTHTGIKSHRCTVCDKLFATKPTLDSHMRTHTGEKPFKCTVCERSFSHRFGRTQHMVTHTKKKQVLVDDSNVVTAKQEATEGHVSGTVELSPLGNIDGNIKQEVSDQQNIDNNQIYSEELSINDDNSAKMAASKFGENSINQDNNNHQNVKLMADYVTQFKLESDNDEVEDLNSNHGELSKSIQHLNNDEGSSSSHEPHFDVAEQKVPLGDGFTEVNKVTNRLYIEGEKMFPGEDNRITVMFPPPEPSTFNAEIENWNSHVKDLSKSIHPSNSCIDPPSSQESHFNVPQQEPPYILGDGITILDTECKNQQANVENSFLNIRAITVDALSGENATIEKMTNASNTGNDQLLHPCSFCGKICISRNQLVQHMGRNHPEEKPYSCSFCEKSFRRNYDLTRHTRRHTGEKLCKCTVCEKSFSDTSALWAHSKIHTGEKPYSCTVCKKSFIANSSLTLHMVVHSEERPYKCSVCSKSFRHRSYLVKHMKIHSETKLFSCTICQKAFINKTTLTNHMRTHTGEKPYICSICGKSFSCSGYLRAHNKTHTGERPHSCTVCEMSFALKSTLRDHLRTHTGEKPYKCIVCEKKFIQKSRVAIHMREHHKGEAMI